MPPWIHQCILFKIKDLNTSVSCVPTNTAFPRFQIFPGRNPLAHAVKACAHTLTTVQWKPALWNEFTLHCWQEQLSLLPKTAQMFLSLCSCSACLPLKHDLRLLVTQSVPLSVRCLSQGLLTPNKITRDGDTGLSVDIEIYPLVQTYHLVRFRWERWEGGARRQHTFTFSPSSHSRFKLNQSGNEIAFKCVDPLWQLQSRFHIFSLSRNRFCWAWTDPNSFFLSLSY